MQITPEIRTRKPSKVKAIKVSKQSVGWIATATGAEVRERSTNTWRIHWPNGESETMTTDDYLIIADEASYISDGSDLMPPGV